MDVSNALPSVHSPLEKITGLKTREKHVDSKRQSHYAAVLTEMNATVKPQHKSPVRADPGDLEIPSDLLFEAIAAQKQLCACLVIALHQAIVSIS